MTAILLTRPVESGNELAELLQAEGIASLHRPMLALHPRTVARSVLLSLDSYDIAIFISRAAASFGLGQLADCWPQWPLLDYMAVGPGTAKVMEDLGVAAIVPALASSEGLLQLPLLQSGEQRRVMIVRGEGGRDLLARTLRQRGFAVDAMEAYERVAVSYPRLDHDLQDHGVSHAVITSVDALNALRGTLNTGELAKLPLIVASQRIAEVAVRDGWRVAAVAQGASDAAMLAAIIPLAKNL